MAKRELIDRNNLESTTIVTDDYSGNEVVDVVLMEDVKEALVITEQEIIEPYLEKLKEQVSHCNLCLLVNKEDVLGFIDNLLSESENI